MRFHRHRLRDLRLLEIQLLLASSDSSASTTTSFQHCADTIEGWFFDSFVDQFDRKSNNLEDRWQRVFRPPMFTEFELRAYLNASERLTADARSVWAVGRSSLGRWLVGA